MLAENVLQLKNNREVREEREAGREEENCQRNTWDFGARWVHRMWNITNCDAWRKCAC